MKININNVNIGFHKEGTVFIAIFFVLSLISISFSGLNFITFLLLAGTGSVLVFFRDPVRVPNLGDENILSAADGIVGEIKEVFKKDEEVLQSCEYCKEESFYKISINIRPLDSHIQRNPVEGKVVDIRYEEGQFLNKSLDKEHKDNEKNHVFILAKNGKTIVISQISGFVSRRIVCYLKVNEDVQQAQQYGIIKFGSRVNMYIPKSSKVKIKEGQTVIAAETVIANF